MNLNNLTNTDIKSFLKDYKNNSSVEVLEEGKEKNDLIKSAKKRGILVKGSKDLAVIKGIYAFTDKFNSNGAKVPSKEFKKKLPGLVGKLLDINHDRTMIVGYYIDYKYIVKEKKALSYAIFFKSAYPKLWEHIKELQKKGKLSQSFEIWSPEKDRKYFKNGTYELGNMEISGGALILEENGTKPAFRDAKVLEIAKSYINKKELVCASKYKEEEIMYLEKSKEWDTEFINNLPDGAFAVIEPAYIKGETDDKRARHLPHHTQSAEGKLTDEGRIRDDSDATVDMSHYQNALSRVSQIEAITDSITTEELKNIAAEHLYKHRDLLEQSIECEHCGEDIDLTKAIRVKEYIKCPNCKALVNEKGEQKYPPQEINFSISCLDCGSRNWIFKGIADNLIKVECSDCESNYKLTPSSSTLQNDILNIVRGGNVTCPQCGQNIKVQYTKSHEGSFTCPQCGLSFNKQVGNPNDKLKISKIEKIKDSLIKSEEEVNGMKIPKEVVERVKASAKAKSEEAEESKEESKEEVDEATENVKVAEASSKDEAVEDSASEEEVEANAETETEEEENELANELKETKELLRKSAKRTIAAKKALRELQAEVEDYKSMVKSQRENTAQNLKKIRSEYKGLAKAFDEKIEFYKANAQTIIERRENLGEDYAQDLSDEDILDDAQYEIASLKKENAELKLASMNEEESEDTEVAALETAQKTSDFYAKKRAKVDAEAQKYMERADKEDK
jgi:predicted nucleic acid-binding Zn ribbon protein